MNWLQISGFIRHIATFGGGFIVAKGWIDATMLNEIVGVVIALGGIVWSMFVKTEKATVASAAAIVNVAAVEQKKVGIAVPQQPVK